MMSDDHDVGLLDVFGTGPMVGGWDEVNWAAKGWPASGETPITLTVSRLSHERWDRLAHVGEPM